MKQDMSAIENKLLECAKTGKRVFLYGKGLASRKKMFRNISNEKSMKPNIIDFKEKDGEKVFKKLTDSFNGVSLKQTDSLFANNLYCDPNRKKDLNYYNKLADVIGESGDSVKWFVVYALNRKDFPPYFQRQFKWVSLKSEDEKIIEVDRDRKLLKYDTKKKKLEPKQLELFDLLWENKGEVVRRKDIRKKLWADYENTHDQISPAESQIDQHVSKLKKGLRELGFNNGIISTIKSKQLVDDGGYIFNSNLASFLK